MNENIYDIKIWREDQKEKEDSISNKSKNNSININNLNNSLNLSSSFNKKLHFSLHSKPIPYINKLLIDNNKFNNSINLTNNKIHKLSKFPDNKKEKDIDLLSKIKKKVTNESIIPKNLNIKINIKDNESNKSDSIHLSKSSNNNLYEEGIISENKIGENNKKESNDEDEDFLSEQKDQMEEGAPNMIKIHSNYIINHNNNSDNNNNKFKYNSNTHKSIKSSINLRNITEPSNPNYMIDPPSGKSNNSGNGGFFAPLDKINRSPIFNMYQVTNNYHYPYKSSFLSTNTNSHNQSGNKIDSSKSNESSQSSHYYSNYQTMTYNQTMSNFRNNNYIYPFTSNVTPIGNKHMYTNNFNTKESSFNTIQPFSINLGSYKKNKYNKFSQNNFGSQTKKEIINLEDVALGKEKRTTIMVRNIPIKYDIKILEKELEPFIGKYDCIYTPYDYNHEGNKGYAFLNLTNPYHILSFYDFFISKSWLFFDSKKVCELNYAKFQGMEGIKRQVEKHKGSKKQIFSIYTGDIDKTIEIPMKYLNLMLKANPKMKYHENKYKNTFIVDSFNSK